MRTTSLRSIFHKVNACYSYRSSYRLLSSDSNVGASNSPNIDNLHDLSSPNSENEADQFRLLLRNSNFINLGDPENKIVRGKIFRTVVDDLYVDFGWKFHCVCPRPTKDGELYVRGSEVLLKIKELELSSLFLGEDKALTLLEADASIIRLISSPVRKN